MVYKATFPTRWQHICRGGGTYWCECTLWAKWAVKQLAWGCVNNLQFSLANKSFHVLRNKRLGVMHVFKDGYFEDPWRQSSHHVSLPFLCNCFLAITVMTHWFSVTTSHSSGNLETSTHRGLDILNTSPVLQLVSRLFPKYVFGSY